MFWSCLAYSRLSVSVSGLLWLTHSIDQAMDQCPSCGWIFRVSYLPCGHKCNWIACKRRSSVKSRACLRRFDDVTGVEKVALQTQKKEKKWRKNVVSLQLNMPFPQTWNTWKFAMFKNFIHSKLLKPIFSSLNHCEPQITKNYRTSKINRLFYHSVTSPFAVKLFLLPVSSHCSMKNIGFNNSGYVVKPLCTTFYRQPYNANCTSDVGNNARHNR